MSFNSLVYAVFLVVVLVFHHAILKSVRQRNWLLFVAGTVFYAAWSIPFLLLLYATVVVDWAVGRALDGPALAGRRRTILFASIALNLGVLMFFKYTNFLGTNLETVLGWIGIEAAVPHLDVDLPLGISFYTLLGLSYTIDVYRRTCSAERSLLDYAVFATFFPHLIAGPILRGRDFLPQVQSPDPAHLRITFGLNRIALGLTKKVLIADWLAQLVEPVYQQPHAFSGVACLIATYLYAFQIYLDFSGYIDIAVGSAALLGYRLPPNFDSPYLARGIAEFWGRWHITLSSWLRDYVYIAFGGNRRGRARMYLYLVLTMLIGGLWHGASWNFVIWGAIHGALLVLGRVSSTRDETRGDVRDPYALSLRAIVLFQAVCLAWVFFRAPTIEIAFEVLRRIGGIPADLASGRTSVQRGLLALVLSPVLLGLYAVASRWRRRHEAYAPTTVRSAWLYGAILALVLCALASFGAPPVTFIYFVF